MNNTKWMSLIEELRSLELPLRYRIKLLTDSEVSKWGTWFAEEPYPYIELEGSVPVPALEVEWLEIDATGPWLSGRRDQFPSNPIDYTVEVGSLLEALRIPFSKEGTSFRVIGHLRRNQSV
jgi:hypothetical protein